MATDGHYFVEIYGRNGRLVVTQVLPVGESLEYWVHPEHGGKIEVTGYKLVFKASDEE